MLTCILGLLALVRMHGNVSQLSQQVAGLVAKYDAVDTDDV